MSLHDETMAQIDAVELLKRQYLQLLDPNELTIPPLRLLRLPGIQAKTYNGMFDESKGVLLPPYRYRFRVLKKLMNAIEEAIEDPDEDEISDELSGCLAQYMAQTSTPASAAAQQKSYVTYTVAKEGSDVPQVTLLEAPSLLASSGTTGFRTWEAALFLGAYLTSPDGIRFVLQKNIIELGAGTGFLSILCAKHLGARYVLATDGSREVVSDLETNVELNGLSNNDAISTKVLQWGHSLINSIADCRGENKVYDLAVGADVTYDENSIPSLIATIRDLFELYLELQVLISATVRNTATLDSFIVACTANGFSIKKMNIPMTQRRKQTGLFVPTDTPIEIFLISRERPMKDPFGL